MHTTTQKKLQITADVSTYICAFFFIFLVFILANPPSGGAALGLIFPLLFVVFLHLILGPVAIISAIATKRFRRNIWIFAYYLLAFLMALWYAGLFRSISHHVAENRERDEHASEVALFVAIEQGDTQEVERLLKAGADSSYCFQSLREYRLHSPLQYAIELGVWEHERHRQGGGDPPRQRSGIVGILLNKGIDPNGICVNQRGKTSLPPVLLALKRPDEQILDLLLHSGADLNPLPNHSALVMAIAGDNYSLPSTPFAAKNHSDRLGAGKVYPVITRLLEAGADVNALQNGATPLHWAVAVGDLRLVDQLLEAGADPNIKDSYGRSSVAWSIRSNVPEITKRLKSQNHNPPHATPDQKITK